MINLNRKNNCIRKYNCLKPVFSLALILIVYVSATAQTFEEMKLQFPDKLAVFSSINKSVEINFSKGVPYANENEVSEMIVLDERANGLFNKGKVYQSHFNELKKVEAYTLTNDGNSTKKIKVNNFKTESSTSRSVFYDDVKEVSFDYPQMVKGSTGHVETEHYNKDIRFLSSFYISNYLPVNQASYSITYPEDMDVRYIIKNDNRNQVKVKESKKGKKKKLEFFAQNINGYEDYADAPAYAYQALHVIVYVASYMKDDQVIPVFSSVDELYKWNAGFIKDINRSVDDNLRIITDDICKGNRNERDRAQAIYRWVQNNIKYVAFEEGIEGFVPRKASDVCNKRYGDCKDMTSLLTAMLQLAGVKAYFTWIGTRSIPYTYSEVPLPITDNHMICAALLNDEWVFLDATDPNCTFGLPTSGIQGKQALVGISNDKYELVTVPVVPADKSVIVDSTFLRIEKNTLLGKCSVDYKGYFGDDVYNTLSFNKGDDERVYARRRMAKGSNKFFMKDYKISFTDTLNKSANIFSTFEIPDYVKSVADEIYINLNLEKLFYSTAIDTSKRKVPIDNEHLYIIQQSHVLSIPENYLVDYCPQNVSVRNDLISFSIDYTRQAGRITATQRLELKKLRFEPDQFKDLNKAILQMSAAYKEQVVLKKK